MRVCVKQRHSTRRQRLPDLRVAGVRVLIEEGLGGQDDAVQAEAALRRLLVDERLLDRVGLLDVPSPSSVVISAPSTRPDRRDAGADRRGR